MTAPSFWTFREPGLHYHAGISTRHPAFCGRDVSPLAKVTKSVDELLTIVTCDRCRWAVEAMDYLENQYVTRINIYLRRITNNNRKGQQ